MKKKEESERKNEKKKGKVKRKKYWLIWLFLRSIWMTWEGFCLACIGKHVVAHCNGHSSACTSDLLSDVAYVVNWIFLLFGSSQLVLGKFALALILVLHRHWHWNLALVMSLESCTGAIIGILHWYWHWDLALVLALGSCICITHNVVYSSYVAVSAIVLLVSI